MGRVINSIGRYSSDTLFAVGKSLNVTEKMNKKSKIIINDRVALRNDWHEVGREVRVAIGRFETKYRIR